MRALVEGHHAERIALAKDGRRLDDRLLGDIDFRRATLARLGRLAVWPRAMAGVHAAGLVDHEQDVRGLVLCLDGGRAAFSEPGELGALIGAGTRGRAGLPCGAAVVARPEVELSAPITSARAAGGACDFTTRVAPVATACDEAGYSEREGAGNEPLKRRTEATVE